MIPVLSREQMRAFDRYAIESCHIPGLVLMENAGRSATDILVSLLPDPTRAAVVCICGPGNNGGDGFVVARHLLTRHVPVRVLLLGRTESVMGDARIHLDGFTDLEGEVDVIEDEAALPILDAALQQATVVVDALFGTGLARGLTGLLAEVVHRTNAARVLRFALDLPSGLDADLGTALGPTIAAHHTVTFGHWKAGLLTPEGARLAGEVWVASLGVPDSIVRHTGSMARILDDEAIAVLAPRRRNAHKHNAGSVAIVAGSRGKTGAAMLAARAALRGGAGLATLATWPESLPAVEGGGNLLEIMTTALPADASASSDFIYAELQKILHKKRAVVVGPGLGTDDRALAIVRAVVATPDIVKIIDADAITVLARAGDDVRALAASRLTDANGPILGLTGQPVKPGPMIFTPHSAELGRLLGISADEVEHDRFGAARDALARTSAIVVLKGARTLVASAEGIAVNPTGTPALATAGSGDVLAGLIAALACTLPAREAAEAAVYLHGLAAEAWAKEHGGADRGMLASELTDRFPTLLADRVRADDVWPSVATLINQPN
jgi:ADP-dependent NAD(P)H-hydrate dehydratase / NAD(P)H-hydrate epimerase